MVKACWLTIGGVTLLTLGAWACAAEVSLDDTGTVHLPAMTVPFSSLASPQARAAFIASHKALTKYASMNVGDISTRRQVRR